MRDRSRGGSGCVDSGGTTTKISFRGRVREGERTHDFDFHGLSGAGGCTDEYVHTMIVWLASRAVVWEHEGDVYGLVVWRLVL